MMTKNQAMITLRMMTTSAIWTTNRTQHKLSGRGVFLLLIFECAGIQYSYNKTVTLMDIEKHKHLLFIGDPRGTSDGSALYLGITRTLKNHFVVPTDFMLWHKKDRIVDTDLFTKELLEAEMAALKKAEVVLVDMAHPHIHSGIMVAHAIHEKKEIYLLHNMDSIADPLSSPLLLYNGANIPQNRWFKYTSASELYPQLTKIIELEKHVSELETSNLVKSFLIEHKLYCLRQVLSMTESQWKALKPSGKVNLHMGNLLRRYNLQDLVLHS